MEQAARGDWVQVFRTILKPEERAPGIPPETAGVPLTMKVKGFLLDERAAYGESVEIKTVTDRVVRGELIAVNPSAPIDYGQPQPDLIRVGPQARRLLREGADQGE